MDDNPTVAGDSFRNEINRATLFLATAQEVLQVVSAKSHRREFQDDQSIEIAVAFAAPHSQNKLLTVRSESKNLEFLFRTVVAFIVFNLYAFPRPATFRDSEVPQHSTLFPAC